MAQLLSNVEHFDSPVSPILNMDFSTEGASMSEELGAKTETSASQENGNSPAKKAPRKKSIKDSKEQKDLEVVPRKRKTPEKKAPEKKKVEEPVPKNDPPVAGESESEDSEGEHPPDEEDTPVEDAKKRAEEDAKKKKEEEAKRKKEEQAKKKREDAKLKKEEAKIKKEEEVKRKKIEAEEESARKRAEADEESSRKKTEAEEESSRKKIEMERESAKKKTQVEDEGEKRSSNGRSSDNGAKSNESATGKNKRKTPEGDNHKAVLALMVLIKKHKTFHAKSEDSFQKVMKGDLNCLKDPSTKETLLVMTRFIDTYYPDLLQQEKVDPLDELL